MQCRLVPGGGPSLLEIRSKIHRKLEFLGYANVQDIGSIGWVVWFGGRVVRSIHQSGNIVGIIT